MFFLFINSLDSLEHFYHLYWFFMTLTFLSLSLFFFFFNHIVPHDYAFSAKVLQKCYILLMISYLETYMTLSLLDDVNLITPFRCCWIFLLYNHWFPFPSSLIMWKINVNILHFIKKFLLDLSVISDSWLIIFTYHEECKWSGRGRD